MTEEIGVQGRRGPPRACFTAVIDDDNGRVFTTVGKQRGRSQRNSSHLCLKLLENCRPRASSPLLPAQKLKGSKPSLNSIITMRGCRNISLFRARASELTRFVKIRTISGPCCVVVRRDGYLLHGNLSS